MQYKLIKRNKNKRKIIVFFLFNNNFITCQLLIRLLTFILSS